MEYDAVVVGVGVVPVRVPRGRLRVDFHVPPAEDAADPDQRIGEIGSAVSVGDAGKADCDRRSVRCQEGEARERLALPDAAERLFARVVPAQVTAPPPACGALAPGVMIQGAKYARRYELISSRRAIAARRADAAKSFPPDA